MKIKICGIRRKEDIQYVNKHVPDYIGFVFAPSKRQVSEAEAKSLKAVLDTRIKAVGVFVNEKLERIVDLCKQGIIDIVQLHGQETQEYIDTLKQQINAPVIKAIPVGDDFVLPLSGADYVLFDAPKGGSGKTFDWDKIKEYKKPFFLAGGISLENIKAACAQKPFCIDVSSGAETNFVKDEGKIGQLIAAVRSYSKEAL